MNMCSDVLDGIARESFADFGRNVWRCLDDAGNDVGTNPSAARGPEEQKVSHDDDEDESLMANTTPTATAGRQILLQLRLLLVLICSLGM
jgi:hypothetical protein